MNRISGRKFRRRIRRTTHQMVTHPSTNLYLCCLTSNSLHTIILPLSYWYYECKSISLSFQKLINKTKNQADSSVSSMTSAKKRQHILLTWRNDWMLPLGHTLYLVPKWDLPKIAFCTERNLETLLFASCVLLKAVFHQSSPIYFGGITCALDHINSFG